MTTRGFITILAYIVGAMLVFIAGFAIFAASERHTEFAISVFGSVIGGFLGALLASLVVIGLYRTSEQA